MPAPSPHPVKEGVEGHKSRIPHRVRPLRQGLAWVPGLRKEQSRPRSPRESTHGAPGASPAVTSVFLSASGSHPGRARVTLSLPGPPGHRPRRLPRQLLSLTKLPSRVFLLVSLLVLGVSAPPPPRVATRNTPLPSDGPIGTWRRFGVSDSSWVRLASEARF